MTKLELYYMQRRTSPAKIEVGTVASGVVLPLAHFVWEAGDQYEWSPDMVISSTNWGLFNQHSDFMTSLAPLNGVVLKPDMMCRRLDEMGFVKLEAKDYQDEFVARWVFADPDLVGSSEYRAIFELLEDAEDWADARATIEEFKDQAAAMLKTLNEEGPDDNG